MVAEAFAPHRRALPARWRIAFHKPHISGINYITPAPQLPYLSCMFHVEHTLWGRLQQPAPEGV
jgi:hypothetical protein